MDADDGSASRITLGSVPLRLTPLLAVLLLATACSDKADTPDTPEAPDALEVTWREASLPVPPRAPGRVAVRDAVKCAGSWYVVGGIFPEVGDSRPAAWRSADGATWTSLGLAPVGYWAQRAVLSSVACRDGRVAMVGAKSGGAHGNPRVTTWYERSDGVWTDVNAPFELYGGPRAVSVGRITSGPPGWLISGNRTSGAAVWISPDATEFELVEGAPQLAQDDEHNTLAVDAAHDGTAWTVVGSAKLPGRLGLVPQAWASTDGRTWQRQEVPHEDGFGDLERVIPYAGGLLAAGQRDGRFGLWQRDGDTWSAGASFGRVAEDARASPFVAGLASVGDDLLATVSDGASYALWTSRGGWRPVAAPVTPTTAGEHILSVATAGDEVLLLADDGTRGRVWLTDW